MHPSGQFVAFACEDEVREYALTDARLELVKRFSTKVPFTGPGGTPFANTQPVSLVRYSHGGHLVAVVCGKLAQVFHLYDLDYSAADMHGKWVEEQSIFMHASCVDQ
jgi:hypothetical protein